MRPSITNMATKKFRYIGASARCLPPHPSPLPWGEGASSPHFSPFTPSARSGRGGEPQARPAILPLPKGEGWGEGEDAIRQPAGHDATLHCHGPILLLAAVLVLSCAQLCPAQAPAAAAGPALPTGLAGEIIEARQKNDALVKRYSWECRTDVLVDGVSKDLRIEEVNYGPAGQLERTLINDQRAPLP